MNKLFLLIILLGIINVSCSTIPSPSESAEEGAVTHIYLVRHAEKADDGTSDPSLTARGKLRAQMLADILSDKEISGIYSSDYKRTKETAFPISRKTKIAVRSYDPRDLNVIANRLAEMQGQNILIVGHSNSTPSLANLILKKEEFKQFDESDYNNLILITMKNGKSSARLLPFKLE